MTKKGDLVVFGALRSGSTLLRLMVDAHPSLHCPGEVDFIFDHLYFDRSRDAWFLNREALQADRIFLSQGLECPDTDEGRFAVHQMLHELRARDDGDLVIMIHRNLNAASNLLKAPRFVHLIRDPRDVAASSIGMGWAGNVYYGADHWVATETEWALYESSISKSSVISVKFEDLIADPQSTLSAICHFFGAPFRPQMLEYHQTSTYDPVDPKLASQWRSKRSAKEVALIELRVGDFLTARGFEPSNIAPVNLGVIQRAGLWLNNKLKTWQGRIARYGLADPVTVAVARRVGLERLAIPAQLRINERVKKFLK